MCERFHFSVLGVQFKNSLSVELKQCANIKTFKKSYKDMIFMRYKERENHGFQWMSLFRKLLFHAYLDCIINFTKPEVFSWLHHSARCKCICLFATSMPATAHQLAEEYEFFPSDRWLPRKNGPVFNPALNLSNLVHSDFQQIFTTCQRILIFP